MRPWSIKGTRPLSGWRSALSLRIPWWRIDWPILFLGLGLLALGLVFVEHMAQADEVYAPGQKPKSVTKTEDQVKDEVLERAKEILKAREVLSTLHVREG